MHDELVNPTSIPSGALNELPTPCLLADLAAIDRNIDRAAAICRNRNVRLRPHFKAHKCTKLLHRQVDTGACSGVTCQTAQEALVLARAGFSDILVANQVVDPSSLRELTLAAAMSTVSVAVDDVIHVELLNAATRDHAVNLGVVIELDVGMARCGLPIDSPKLLPIAQAIRSVPRLHLLGIQGYEGHIVMREDLEVRRTLLWQVYEQMKFERKRLEDGGFACQVVSGAGTGTLELAAEAGVVTEIQAGSYVMMDAKYDSLHLPFEPALYVGTRVLSRRSREVGVLNAGLKEFSVENGLPAPVDGNLAVAGVADEHTRISVRSGATPGVGDLVLLVPRHIDPTMNLHDVLYVWAGGPHFEEWAIDGRRLGAGQPSGNAATSFAQG
jgi:D-serine deaminase-like pyridoxal phosphate-dependent protein